MSKRLQTTEQQRGKLEKAEVSDRAALIYLKRRPKTKTIHLVLFFLKFVLHTRNIMNIVTKRLCTWYL